MDVFNIIAGIASILGFALTIWTLREVQSLKANVVLAAQGRELLTQLVEVRRRITTVLGDGDADLRPGRTDGRRAAQIVKNLSEMFGGADKLQLVKYAERIEAFTEHSNFDRDGLYEVLDLTVQVGAMVEHWVQTKLLTG